MEVFPLIYSRSHYMDYSQSFYVCPEIFNEPGVIENVRKYIVDSISYANMLDDMRRVIVSENGYTSAGIVIDLKRYVSSLPTQDDYSKYVCDAKGRNIVAFLGVSFFSESLKRGDAIENFDEVIFNVFKDYIVNSDRWFSKDNNHYISTGVNVRTGQYHEKLFGNKVVCCGKSIYECSHEADKSLFYAVMSRCGDVNHGYLFCSNYYGIEAINHSPFRIITSKHVKKILRFNEEIDSEQSKAGTELFKGIKEKIVSQKKKIVRVIIILSILIVITFVILLIKIY